MPFSPEAPSSAPYWFHDNTTGAVTGLYKDLLDAVFTAANLTYSLGGFSEKSGYTDLGEELTLPRTHPFTHGIMGRRFSDNFLFFRPRLDI